jgi:hypothetical protein
MALSRNDSKSTLSKDYGVFATHNPIRIRYTHLVSILVRGECGLPCDSLRGVNLDQASCRAGNWRGRPAELNGFGQSSLDDVGLTALSRQPG